MTLTNEELEGEINRIKTALKKLRRKIFEVNEGLTVKPSTMIRRLSKRIRKIEKR